MIPQFLVSNIDAIISTALGGFLTIYALRRREDLLKSSNRLTRLLPVLAPFVMIFGLIQFFIHGDTIDRPSTWKVIQTDDGVAHVEFPVAPKRTEATDRAGDVDVHRVSHIVNLAGGKLDLRLSFSEYPPQSKNLTDDEKIAGMRELFTHQGFKIVEDTELSDGVRNFVIVKLDDDTKIFMRVRMLSSGIYRALSTSMPGHHNDPRIERFLSSFTINKNRP